MNAADDLLSTTGMSSTFTHKFFLMVLAGFAAACLFWAFRHIIQEALFETSDAGWRQGLRH